MNDVSIVSLGSVRGGMSTSWRSRWSPRATWR